MMIYGRAMFAIGILFLGCLCSVYGNFIIGRPPAWPQNSGLDLPVGYLLGFFCVVAAFAILARIKSGIAAFSIAITIFLFSVTRHVLFYAGDYLNALKALALVGSALIVATSTDDVFTVRTRKSLLFTGTLLISVFFLACGYAHFKFADFVTEFIPTYIPFRRFFAYFCGICLVAGGIGLLIPYTRKLAAFLSACMLTGWFVLLHIPRFLANTQDASDRMGLCESFAFAGTCFVLTALFRKRN